MCSHLPLRLSILLGAALCLASCAQPNDDDRTAWLQTTLTDDNLVWLERHPALVEGKLRKMTASDYPWFRGTASQFVRDLYDGPGALRTRFGTAASSRVALVGDPHLENIGSYRAPDGTMLADFNDFDGATFGPFHSDVRRLALSAFTLGTLLGLSESDREALYRATTVGYVEALLSQSAGGPPDRVRQGGGGLILDDLLRRAKRDGDDGTLLAQYTEIIETERVFLFGEHEPFPSEDPLAGLYRDHLAPVPVSEAAAVEALVATWPETTVHPEQVSGEWSRVKGIAQRLGAGVSSYPADRFYVLVEGPTPANDDDRLLELKEVATPVQFPQLRFRYFPRPASEAERSVIRQRALQESAENDRLLGWAVFPGAPRSFRVRERTAYQKNVSTDRIQLKVAEGEWTQHDLTVLCRRAGRLLARAHANGTTADGSPSLPVIAEAITAAGQADRSGGDLLTEETAQFVATYGPVMLDDRLRVKTLHESAPRLGYRSAP